MTDEQVIDESILEEAVTSDEEAVEELPSTTEELSEEANIEPSAEGGPRDDSEPDSSTEPAAEDAELQAQGGEAEQSEPAVASEEASEQAESIPAQETAPVLADEVPRLWWWPFVTYALLWVALVAASYVILTGEQAQTPAFWQEYYPYVVLAGLVLTLLGPLLAVTVWIVAWFKAGKGRRGGLFTKAILRAAALTFLGVVLWVGCLILVDALRLGVVQWGA